MSYSARVIQKLQGREEVKFSSFDYGEIDEKEDNDEDSSNYVTNKFALLNDSGSDKEIIQDDSCDEPSRVTIEDTNEFVPSSSKSKTKRRKQKRKNRSKASNSEENPTSSGAGDEFCNLDNQPSSSKQKDEAPSKSVLIVEHRYLNPDNELRRIFGTRVLLGDASYRRRMQGPSYKGVWLTQPQNNWTKLGKSGISMKLIETNGSIQTFKYEHNREYQKVQFDFLDAVDSMDHRNIGSVLEVHPYHVDALLTFSDVYKMHEDLKMARELIERCLFRLERSFHSCFNITTGKSRLPYKYPENRCLFLALYKHMNFVSQRGCNRTALELCKVLLSLDPEEDPLCSIFMFDYFALRSAQYEFLVKFSQESDKTRNLSQLPNWAYSLSLAQFHLAKSEGSGSIENADEALQNALIAFPTVLLSLLNKCSVQPDSEVSSHPLFTTEAHQSSPKGLLLLCHLFVERNYLLWKDPEVLAWLEKNVNVVLKSLKEKDDKIRFSSKKRKMRYQKPPLNVYRHALISELPDVSSLLPLEIRTGTLLSHDPLPPTDSVSSYKRPARPAHRGRVRNPVSLFFQSLLPDFNPDDPQAFLDAHAEEVAVEGAEVQGNVQTLMNALRDLLNNFQQPINESDQEDFEQDWD